MRCRPLFERERAEGGRAMLSSTETEVMVEPYASYQSRKGYVFDRVLGATCGQRQLFEECILPSVRRSVEGFSCTVMAYGQTGTGAWGWGG